MKTLIILFLSLTGSYISRHLNSDQARARAMADNNGRQPPQDPRRTALTLAAMLVGLALGWYISRL